MLVLEGNTITSQGYKAKYLTRDGRKGEEEVGERMIFHESWTCFDGELVLLPDERIIDIGGYMLLLPDDLNILGSWNGRVITLLAYRSEGVISEWNDWSPFLIKEWNRDL
jgi:hypothetical protein